jgi:hypothetical protein
MMPRCGRMWTTDVRNASNAHFQFGFGFGAEKHHPPLETPEKSKVLLLRSTVCVGFSHSSHHIPFSCGSFYRVLISLPWKSLCGKIMIAIFFFLRANLAGAFLLFPRVGEGARERKNGNLRGKCGHTVYVVQPLYWLLHMASLWYLTAL